MIKTFIGDGGEGVTLTGIYRSYLQLEGTSEVFESNPISLTHKYP